MGSPAWSICLVLFSCILAVGQALLAPTRALPARKSQRLDWNYWIDHFHPGRTAPPLVSTTTRPPPTEAPFPQGLLQGTVSPQDIRNAQCGVPRLGGDDPFELTNLNLGVWGEQTRGRGNFSVFETIVGGEKIDPGEACWQAKIQRDGSFICGASIIGKQTIMTAMHCVRNPRGAYPTDIYFPTRFRVTVGAPKSDTDVPGGSEDPTGCAQDFGVVRIVGNSRFNTQTNENDVAIMTLDSEIDFSGDCVCPICLRSTIPKVGEICAVSGYGLLQEGGPAAAPRPLKYVHLNILPTTLDSNCYIQEDSGNTLNLNNILCAGDVPGEDSCQGDSGGPVVCLDPVTRKHYQAGIVSYGSGCARGVGGVYTRVSSFLQWIKLNSGGDLLSFPQ